MPADITTIIGYQGLHHKNKQRRFLRKFIENIAKRSREYSRLYLKEHGILANGLLTGERGSYSLMAAAMDRITPMHESEMSVKRRRAGRGKTTGKTGRVDLWSCFDGLEYFMEFKRSYTSANSIHDCVVTERVDDRWKSLKEQVDTAKRGVADNPDYKEFKDRTYVIGMHTITPYRTSTDREKIIESLGTDQFNPGILQYWVQELSPEPDAVLVWKIAEEQHKFLPISWDGDQETRWGAYPCHLFCFRIVRIDQG
ncbi:MAG: hypothetical protein OXF88_23900 [Rhodobacteraceae bacterium]|nr:hypothetical protein [Paracoccaceae bacterium]